MKRFYLVLAVIGFLVPNYFVLLESLETGNILLYGNMPATIKAMFANRISSIFILDLLFAVLVFFIWTYREAQHHGIQRIWVVWLFTMLFGFAGGFPLFLYLREKSR